MLNTRQLIRLTLAVAVLIAARGAQAQQTATPPTRGPAVAAPAGQTMRYEADVRAFLDTDRTTPPPKDGILFIGSSIFRQWTTLAEQMAPLPVFNRAFGGSRTWEVLHYADRIVIPYRPRFVVYYCGSNDVNGKEDAVGIVNRTVAFFERVHDALPGTTIFYVAIQRAPDKRARWAVVDSTNAAVARYATAHSSYIRTIDLNPVLFDGTGNPRGELYRPDSLHFLPPAYVEFTAVIKPVLTKAWAQP